MQVQQRQNLGDLGGTSRSAASKRGTVASTQEYLTRHVLESFLDRLTRTWHADDFLLKGGILISVQEIREQADYPGLCGAPDRVIGFVLGFLGRPGRLTSVDTLASAVRRRPRGPFCALA